MIFTVVYAFVLAFLAVVSIIETKNALIDVSLPKWVIVHIHVVLITLGMAIGYIIGVSLTR